SKRDTVLRSIPSFRAMADFERPLANNSRTCNTSSPLYIPSPPLGRVWRRRSSEVGIFHSGDFAEYVSGGFVHFSSGDDTAFTPPSSQQLVYGNSNTEKEQVHANLLKHTFAHGERHKDTYGRKRDARVRVPRATGTQIAHRTGER